MTEIFFPLTRTSEKQHCDKAKMEEGEKIADSAINVCLRGPRKNLIIPGVFSCRSCEYAKARGKRTGCSEGRAVNSIFAFPTRMTLLPPLSAGGAEKKGPRAFMSPASFAAILRGVTRSIYSARESVRGCNEVNCEFASPNSRLRFANREIGDDYRKLVHLQLLCATCS